MIKVLYAGNNMANQKSRIAAREQESSWMFHIVKKKGNQPVSTTDFPAKNCEYLGFEIVGSVRLADKKIIPDCADGDGFLFTYLARGGQKITPHEFLKVVAEIFNQGFTAGVKHGAE